MQESGHFLCLPSWCYWIGMTCIVCNCTMHLYVDSYKESRKQKNTIKRKWKQSIPIPSPSSNCMYNDNPDGRNKNVKPLKVSVASRTAWNLLFKWLQRGHAVTSQNLCFIIKYNAMLPILATTAAVSADVAHLFAVSSAASREIMCTDLIHYWCWCSGSMGWGINNLAVKPSKKLNVPGWPQQSWPSYFCNPCFGSLLILGFWTYCES